MIDRKSTRLNSSHVSISYAVFCLKKKTTHDDHVHRMYVFCAPLYSSLLSSVVCFYFCLDHPDLLSFPTRRSSDLGDYASIADGRVEQQISIIQPRVMPAQRLPLAQLLALRGHHPRLDDRSEEHTSELQSRFDLVCRLLLEKKNHTRRPRPPDVCVLCSTLLIASIFCRLFLLLPRPPGSTLFPYTTLFRSRGLCLYRRWPRRAADFDHPAAGDARAAPTAGAAPGTARASPAAG